jgi:ATP synthase protein I
MAADARKSDDEGVKTADEAALSARLKRLGQRLEHTGVNPAAHAATEARQRGDASALARALRLSAELVGGVLFGAGLGWLIDYALGTSPWGLIVLLLLGFAGGVLSVMRSAGVIPQRKV